MTQAQPDSEYIYRQEKVSQFHSYIQALVGAVQL